MLSSYISTAAHQQSIKRASVAFVPKNRDTRVNALFNYFCSHFVCDEDIGKHRLKSAAKLPQRAERTCWADKNITHEILCIWYTLVTRYI